MNLFSILFDGVIKIGSFLSIFIKFPKKRMSLGGFAFLVLVISFVLCLIILSCNTHSGDATLNDEISTYSDDKNNEGKSENNSDSSKPLSNGMTKDKGEEILAAGIAYFDNGDCEAAMECFLQLSSDSKQYSEAQSLLLKSKDAYRNEILERVNSHIENKDYDVALNLISQAQEVLPDDSELKGAYDDVYSAYRSSVLKQVDTYILSNQYEVALEYLQGVQKKFPNDAILQDSYSSTLFAYQAIVRTEAIEQADAYVADGNYENAIKTVNTALNKIGRDEELSAKLAVYENVYRDMVVIQVENILRTEGYQEAISVLNQGLTILPDDDMLMEIIKTYRTYAPVPLASFESYEDTYTGISKLADCKDRRGNTYLDGYYGAWGGCYSTYLLDYQYGQLSGNFVMLNVEDVHRLSDRMTVIIYGDDMVLYSGSLTVGESENLSFKVDVSNVKWLKIYMDCYNVEPLAALVNVNFTKAYE